MIKLNLPELPARDAALLDRVIAPTKTTGLPVEVARFILEMGFADEDVQRINELSAKAREGTLTSEEDEDLNSYLRIGHFLSMLKSEARAAIKRSNRSK